MAAKDKFGYETKRLLTDDNDNSQDVGFASCRSILGIMGFFGFTSLLALRTNISVAIVAMVNNTEAVKVDVNASTSCPGDSPTTVGAAEQSGEFNWDSNIQGLILGSFFYGYMSTPLAGGLLAERFGSKWLIGGGVLGSACMTMLVPTAARIGVAALVVSRIIAGLCEGITVPAMHAMMARWVPPMERSRYSGFVYSGILVGPTISMPVSGFLCKSSFMGGWPSVFYVFGTLGCLWFVFWCFLIYDDPVAHPRISDAERMYIQKSMGCKTVMKLSTPWCSIFSSPPVWAIIVAHFTNKWGFYTMLTCLPKYLHEVLGLDLAHNGVVSGIPFFFTSVVMTLGGRISDVLRTRRVLSTEQVRKLFTMCGKLIPATVLVAVSFVGCNKLLAIILLTIAVATAGMSSCGFLVNHLDIASPFAGTLMGLSNGIGNISGFLAPQVVGFITKDNPSRENWQMVFYISAAMYGVGATIYVLFAKGEEQEWSKAHRLPSVETPTPDTESDDSEEEVYYNKALNASGRLTDRMQTNRKSPTTKMISSDSG